MVRRGAVSASKQGKQLWRATLHGWVVVGYRPEEVTTSVALQLCNHITTLLVVVATILVVVKWIHAVQNPRSNDDPSCGSSFQVELLVESVGSLMRGQWL